MAEARFRTHVLLKSIIGKDLITDDNIAVIELVKNSFDANSKRVEIIFNNIEKNDDKKIKNKPTSATSAIIIKDAGIGMNEKDLRDKWLNIAYSEKKIKKEDFGRVLAGNKGVGRFSCDKLGEYLSIYTRKLNGEIFHLQIDWKKFEIDNDIAFNIQDVKLDISPITENEFKTKTGFVGFKKGTILQINKVREEWNADKIITLKRYLEKLINPNQAFKKNSFDIEIIAKEFIERDRKEEEHNKINGSVKNKIFEKLNFRTSSIEAQIDEEGETITTILQDRGNRIFTLVEKNPFFLLKNIRVTVYYLNPYSKVYFAKQTGMRSVDFGSIFLFINGFRIPPYGDVGDDWLGLEIRKGQGYSRFLGTREVVGRIEINDDHDQFKVISNREGVVNNAPFSQLTKSDSPFGFFYRNFRRLERFVVEGIKWDSIPKSLEKEIESKINSDPAWNIRKEVFVEDEIKKSKRILALIAKLIDSKTEVISLDINEKFITQILDEQTKKAQKELDEVVKDLKNKNLTPEQLSAFIYQLNEKRNELEGLTSTLADSSIKTSKTEITKFNKIKKEVESTYNEVIELRNKLQEIAKENQKIAQQLEDEKKKNIFLLATSKNVNNDTLGLIHHIQHETPKIDSEVETLISQINHDDFKKKDILSRLYKIKLYTNKVATIGKLITRTNFNEQAKKQKLDLVKYIVQYISIYKEISTSELSFTVNENNSVFQTKLSAIEVSIIFDNLIHNSHKAGAKRIQIDIKSVANKRLEIFFSDDGKGLNKQFIDNPSVVFELGITSTDGSGIGLYTVNDLVKKMRGDIQFVGNNKILKGATFKLLFNQEI